ncbi:MAG: dTDP-4-dehydrorhamnose 3,5-epimerase [Bacteroidales bacterium]|nr:dTDP-4-dehydrorhamnose 3,5-epimerase [Bacteroidales bacterium]
MQIKETDIEGLFVLEPQVFRDPRGYFLESYHKSRLEKHDVFYEFIQDNQSQSSYGVIRGLHFQKEPHAQTKLIRVIEGTVFDVAVDIRPGSPTYGHWFGLEISAENHLQLLVPKGFAHGFSVLSQHATVFYKCDAYYHPDSESGIHYNDPDLQIDWKIDLKSTIVSEKDRQLPHLKHI